MEIINKYLEKTGQTFQELMGGAFSYGFNFIQSLVDEALEQNKKIVWRDDPEALDKTTYTLEDI